MNFATHSSFPNFAWLGFRITCEAKPALFANHIQSRCHMVGFMAQGSQTVRWIRRGDEKRWRMNSGAVNFFPRDGEQHTFIVAKEPFLDMPVFLIPDAHFRECLNTDHCDSRAELRHDTFGDDAVLQSCFRRLATQSQPVADNTGMQNEEAARQLVLRLVELCGGGRPDWHTDTGAFDRRTMRHLVDYIDGHLQTAPSLSGMASLVRLSPSHFAKKFRQSAGLSVDRFINLRRVRRALDTLKENRDSLASIAVNLGFFSQSHFTRVFSGLTGMTPARYQKQFKRVIG